MKCTPVGCTPVRCMPVRCMPVRCTPVRCTPDTLQSMHNLAVGYDEAGRRSEALQLTEQVVQLRKAKLGEGHPDTIWWLGTARPDDGRRP